MKKWLRNIVIVITTWFIIETITTIYIGLKNPKSLDETELIVVFGNTVNEDGSLSARLQARLDVALSVYKENPNSKLLVSGGLGKEGYYEGDKMKEYLIKKGLSSPQILVDNKGNNTLKTIEKTKVVCDSLKINTVLFATQFYHKRRVLIAAKIFNFGQAECISANFYELRDGYSLFREFFAIQKYRF